MLGCVTSVTRVISALSSRPHTGARSLNDGVSSRYQRAHRHAQSPARAHEIATHACFSRPFPGMLRHHGGEIYAGMRPAEAPLTSQFFSTLVWLETSFAVAQRAGALRYEWARKGIITDNRKDFPMPELTIHPLQ